MLNKQQQSCIAEEGLLKLFNRQSLLSSNDAGWNGIRFQLTRSLGAGAASQEIFFPQDVIHICTDMPSGYLAQARIDGRQFHKNSLVTGHCLIIPHGVPYWIADNLKGTGITLGFDMGFLGRNFLENPDRACWKLHPQFPIFDPVIYQIALALQAELERNPQGSRLYAESAVTFLATHLLHHYAERTPSASDYQGGLPKSKLQAVIDYIYAHLDRDIGLTDLAAIVEMSPYYFSRLFKQSTGYSPHQFVIKCRVEQAKQLLINSDLSIAEISYIVGFANQSHLTNHCKRMLGVTPKIIRNK